ncbi:MAG: GNAT family N-acetyltransferase [Thermomonas sp.]
MNATVRGFSVSAADYARDGDALRAVREAVFVREQGVPLELELDAQDPDCLHVLARDAGGRPIGTGRLTPARTLGRMAVLPEWRGKGVGAALLDALTAIARERRWRAIELHAQADAIGFYARHGYLPFGPRYMEAGIEHQSMRRALQGPNAVEDREAAIAATIAIATTTRRCLRVYSRALDPGLFDAPPVLDALRRLAVRGDGIELRFLLQDADSPQREQAPLIALSQRLPSVVLFRAVDDPVDRAYPSAFLANDGGGYYFRGLGHRFDGETALDAGGRARQLREEFDRTWERSRPCSEYRALGL